MIRRFTSSGASSCTEWPACATERNAALGIPRASARPSPIGTSRSSSPQRTSVGAATCWRRPCKPSKWNSRNALLSAHGRRVILVHISLGHFSGIGIRRLEEAGRKPAPAQREHSGSHHRPATDAEHERLARAKARRPDQDEAAHALGVLDRHLGGDSSTHGMADEHCVHDVQRVQKRDGQPGVAGVIVASGGLVGEPKATVVERDYPEPRRRDRSQVLAPRVQ